MRRPLNRSITIACVIFIVLLCGLLSLTTYLIYTNTMYNRFQKELASVVNYVEGHVDIDDMSECARTNVESETYKKCQLLLDDMIDRYTDIEYLYITAADVESSPVQMVVICSANSSYEKEFYPENVLHLGDSNPDWYSPEVTQKFHEIQMGNQDVYFINPSEWGSDYTLARPLIDSEGRHFGMLCADIPIAEINETVYRNIGVNIVMILIYGIIFTLLLLLWMRANVTKPLRRLEQSVMDFAHNTTDKRNPDDIYYVAPEIRLNNEVRSLANAMTKLSDDMRDYVKNMNAAEKETRDLQEHVLEINSIAYQDALTKAKNKAAYDNMEKSLQGSILAGGAEFAIVMADLNDLKKVNDLYGHKRRNDYIVGSCRMICETFKYSPVYRIGGDEFVVVLQVRDYQQREQLCSELRSRFEASAENEAAEPWERYSAALGMSVYAPGDQVDTVFKRADQDMYERKMEYKAKHR